MWFMLFVDIGRLCRHLTWNHLNYHMTSLQYQDVNAGRLILQELGD